MANYPPGQSRLGNRTRGGLAQADAGPEADADQVPPSDVRKPPPSGTDTESPRAARRAPLRTPISRVRSVTYIDNVAITGRRMPRPSARSTESDHAKKVALA